MATPEPNQGSGLSAAALADVPDDALVSAYLAGDQPAFEVLYARHKGPLYRYLLRQLPKSRAEEAFQETWLKVIKALPSYEPQGKLQAFLFRICHNVLMDQHRTSMRDATQTGADESVTEDSDPVAQVEDSRSDVVANVSAQELRNKLMQGLAELPVAQRSAWILKHETQLSVAEIAELTETTAEGVKSRLRYATDKLKNRMRKYV